MIGFLPRGRSSVGVVKWARFPPSSSITGTSSRGGVAGAFGWVVALMVTVLTFSRAAQALSLQEISEHAHGRVVHLSVRNAHGEEESSGSGFIISSSGRVATNFHVIEGAERLFAVFPDKKEVKVTGVWAFDKKVDLAVLQLEPGTYQPLTLAQAPAHAGEDIVVIGSPLGLGNAISTGIISAVREQGIDRPEYHEDMKSWTLQFTAAAAHGSSGSPILRTNGEVVGVAVGIIDGLEFGIAVDELRRLAASAPAKPQTFGEVLGARSVTRNLLISGAFFASLAVLWVGVSRISKLRQRARRGSRH